MAARISSGVGSETVALNDTLPDGKPSRSAVTDTVAAPLLEVPDDWSLTWTPVMVPVFGGEPTSMSRVSFPLPAGMVTLPSVRNREMSTPAGALIWSPVIVTPRPLSVVWNGEGVGCSHGGMVGSGSDVGIDSMLLDHGEPEGIDRHHVLLEAG